MTGVADIPKCTSANSTICQLIEDTLELGVYNSFVQDHVVRTLSTAFAFGE